jgi:hypothetical protein
MMAFSLFHRPLTLILVLALVLMPQVSVQAAMTMQSGHASTADMPMIPSDMCDGCAGKDSTAVPSDCLVRMCSVVVAVLPAPILQIIPVLGAPYAATVFQGEHGVTIAPDPAPPRLTHLV